MFFLGKQQLAWAILSLFRGQIGYIMMAKARFPTIIFRVFLLLNFRGVTSPSTPSASCLEPNTIGGCISHFDDGSTSKRFKHTKKGANNNNEQTTTTTCLKSVQMPSKLSSLVPNGYPNIYIYIYMYAYIITTRFLNHWWCCHLPIRWFAQPRSCQQPPKIWVKQATKRV